LLGPPGSRSSARAGRHTRCAVGMAELPFDIAVEIEMVVEVD
jgi:enamine deaminase RidA (YjgF/YER057c/UK114 family)